MLQRDKRTRRSKGLLGPRARRTVQKKTSKSAVPSKSLLRSPSSIINTKNPFNEALYWEKRYQIEVNSGPGSRDNEARLKINAVRTAIAKYNVASILDLGLGDAELAAGYLEGYPNIHYTGIDVSLTAIVAAADRLKYHENVSLRKGDIIDTDDVADLVICLDVLFHLPTRDKYEKAIDRICKSFHKLAIISAWTPNITKLYRNKLAMHTFFYEEFSPTDNARIVDTIELIPNTKYIYLLEKSTLNKNI